MREGRGSHYSQLRGSAAAAAARSAIASPGRLRRQAAPWRSAADRARTRRRLVLHLLLQPDGVLLWLPQLPLGVREEAHSPLALRPVSAHLEQAGGRGTAEQRIAQSSWAGGGRVSRDGGNRGARRGHGGRCMAKVVCGADAWALW